MIQAQTLLIAIVAFQGAISATAAPEQASSYAGSTTTAVFPPPGVTPGTDDALFPPGSVVGYPGPTPTGDEAESLATAPALSKQESFAPLVEPDPADAHPGYGGKKIFNILQNWGALSPWQSNPADSFGLPDASPLIPKGCSLNQVHLLHRHGARYPTGDSSVTSFAANIHAVANNGSGFDAMGRLSFLNTWKYKLGAEILTPFGRQQLFNLGTGFRVKYGELLKKFSSLPVFRTTSQGRMLDSALHFAAGFFGVQSYQSDYHQLITIENNGFNNTLAAWANCPNANNAVYAYGSTQATKWSNVYLKNALNRIGALFNSKEYTLRIADLVAMQQLCAYETVALGYSEFCGLFTEEEWKGFEYFWDLQFWYSAGPGNPASSAQGIGYVQELLSRLTKTPISDFNSGVNSSIVTNSKLFPLDQPIYVDASHDTVISSILTAMNFTSLAATGPLPTDHMPEPRSYNINQISPFATNLVGQVLSCPSPSANSSEATHIRWILNDAVLPLTGVKGCETNKDGLCEIGTYITGLKQRIAEVDFKYDCFANYTVPEPDNIVDGRFPVGLRNATSV
ncbi:histidine phosphatase superfamily [Crepidotus variabilis]|uniref:Histidine phosphatase superfamily n=1 Tax=Crepidotus variabilis TaxID=179855 RepID=A0A9P6E6X3_9AGAR|nr:histidine phosphatase superfamily [Crepidotus variabilis]